MKLIIKIYILLSIIMILFAIHSILNSQVILKYGTEQELNQISLEEAFKIEKRNEIKILYIWGIYSSLNMIGGCFILTRMKKNK